MRTEKLCEQRNQVRHSRIWREGEGSVEAATVEKEEEEVEKDEEEEEIEEVVEEKK